MAVLKYDEDNCVYQPSVQSTVELTASMAVLASNASRMYLAIQNNGTGSLYVSFDAQIPTLLNSIKIPAGRLWEPRKIPSGAINLIADTAATPVVIIEADASQ